MQLSARLLNKRTNTVVVRKVFGGQADHAPADGSGQACK
jgi:ABC-type uncharacterized transport system auxiliary subunit